MAKPPHVLVLGGGFVAHHHVYQPGETIAESVRPGQLVHVIVEGEVEITGSEGVLETLGPGEHFGRSGSAKAR